MPSVFVILVALAMERRMSSERGLDVLHEARYQAEATSELGEGTEIEIATDLFLKGRSSEH